MLKLTKKADYALMAMKHLAEHSTEGSRSAKDVAAASTPASARMASRPGTTVVGNRSVPALTPGDRVNHDKFGLGTVFSTDGYGDSAEAKIDFGGSYGIKHLVLRYAPLEKL